MIIRVHRAGPREKIYFRPEEVKAAIVTCGGLCPGLNDVIRHVSLLHLFHVERSSLLFIIYVCCLLQIVITLEIYGVKNVVGIPFGYRGFTDKNLPEMPV